MKQDDIRQIGVCGSTIEYRWFEPSEPPDLAPIVLLHHAFGCVADWRDFPTILAAATNRRVIAYSRHGCGRSSPLPLLRDKRYLHEEAEAFLPAFLDAVDLSTVHLFGHSDGATIALLCAAAHQSRILPSVIEAPHVFAEDVTLAGVASARARYLSDPDYRRRIARYHADPDGAFFAWTDTWLSPTFGDWSILPDLPAVVAELLVVQGDQDAYGTLEHVETIKRGNSGKVVTEIIPNGQHVPHAENPEYIARRAAEFFSVLA